MDMNRYHTFFIIPANTRFFRKDWGGGFCVEHLLHCLKLSVCAIVWNVSSLPPFDGGECLIHVHHPSVETI